MKKLTMRIAHRYLGFFLLGIMLIYSLSGVILVFRNTDTFKVATEYVERVEPGLGPTELASQLDIRRLRDVAEVGDLIQFDGGVYDKATGEASYSTTDYPPVIKQMTELHTSSTKDGTYILNVGFGLGLLFFSLSSFWMFRPKTKIFKQGMLAVGAGLVFALILLMV